MLHSERLSHRRYWLPWTQLILPRGSKRVARRAERVAAHVQLREGEHFVRARRRIREALKEDGIAQKIDRLVAELLLG